MQIDRTVMTILVGIGLLLPVTYAAGGPDPPMGEDPLPWQSAQFGSCPSGFRCNSTPDDDPFPPDTVTGHTVYASWIMERNREQVRRSNQTLGLPTDFAAIAGFFAFEDREKIREEVARGIQRECVLWFNGMNLDQRPEDDRWGPGNSFPSDEDEVPYTTHQQAYQDYDFDRDVPNCEPRFSENGTVKQNREAGHARFAVAVEKGDCNPGGPLAGDFRYRGHLDFVDPNGVYHEVQEYDYVCNWKLPRGAQSGRLDSIGLGPAQGSAAQAVKDFFPWTYTDPHNEGGCGLKGRPGPSGLGGTGNGTDDPGYFDLGHKCNGSLQDLFTERLWITPVHEPMWDPTIESVYNFALQIDTCAGINIYELNGKRATGPDEETNMGTQSHRNPGGTAASYHNTAYHNHYGSFRESLVGDWPLFDVCTDGSSFSFNDTPRGRVVHTGPPEGTKDQQIMRGNSYDFDEDSDTFGKHRTNCRVQDLNWPMNTHPAGPPGQGDDCYPEDHKTAQVDIYVFEEDPTDLWDLHARTDDPTGPGKLYLGPGRPTGPA